jgi:hypothetical protein
MTILIDDQQQKRRPDGRKEKKMNANTATRYDTTSVLTEQVCATIGAIYNIQFVATKQRGNVILVKGTAGKPREFAWLRRQCREHGYTYVGGRRS